MMLVDALTPEQAARRAHIRNLNAAKRAPLFAAAGLIEQVTAEDVLAQHDEYVQWLAERERQDDEHTAAMRATLVQLVGEETVAAWDAYAARVYPHKAEYVRGYYREQFHKQHGCTVYCYQCEDDCPLALEMRGTRRMPP